jgi:hypothetical protein
MDNLRLYKQFLIIASLMPIRLRRAKMNHNNIKILMDHSLGESQNCHIPTEDELIKKIDYARK